MIENGYKRERGAHGWYQKGPRSYASLLKSDAVQMLVDSLSKQNKAGALYQFQHFLEYSHLSPEELLGLPDEEIKSCIRKAVIHKRGEGAASAGRVMFYTVRRFLELNGREISFNKTEKKALLKQVPKRIGREYIPTREDIYRMVDAFPDHGALQRKRGQALILCDWQSGVRANCLCSWTFAMFKDQLWPTIKFPVKIKVASDRPEGVTDCAVDTKLSSYNVNYYYTFLAEEGARTVKDYLEERQKQGWKPKDSDPVFVTHGTVIEENGRPLNAQHVVDVVKSAAKQIGIDPSKIWTHCLRKAFRKTLYSSGVDPDIAEALMGHKLGASRGSYFDYHDIKFAEDNYKRASWTRLGVERFQQMENELAELRKIRVEHEALVTNGQSKASEIQDLKVQVLSLASTLKLWEELMARSGIKLKPTRKDEK